MGKFSYYDCNKINYNRKYILLSWVLGKTVISRKISHIGATSGVGPDFLTFPVKQTHDKQGNHHRQGFKRHAPQHPHPRRRLQRPGTADNRDRFPRQPDQVHQELPHLDNPGRKVAEHRHRNIPRAGPDDRQRLHLRRQGKHAHQDRRSGKRHRKDLHLCKGQA